MFNSQREKGLLHVFIPKNDRANERTNERTNDPNAYAAGTVPGKWSLASGLIPVAILPQGAESESRRNWSTW